MGDAQPVTDRCFTLGEWTVDPSQRLLYRGDEQRLLEPKSLAVLLCLARTPSEVVSWDRLIKDAWNGRVISDDAVHRQVSKLRNALDDDPRAPRYIETLPKTGFRLLAPVQPITATGPGNRAKLDSESARRHRWMRVVAIALLGLAVLWLGSEYGPPNSSPGSGSIQQLTAEAGLERFPALSPSGRSLVYARRATAGGPWQLQVMEMDARQPQRFGEFDGDALYPAWSPDGERVAYIGWQNGNCELRISGLYPGSDRPLAPCRDPAAGGGLSWTPDSRTLVYSDRREDGRFQLFRVSLDSGERAALLEPEADSNGDTTPRIRADGALAFLRNRAIGIEDVYWLPQGVDDTNPPRRLSHDHGVIQSMNWMGEALVLRSSRAGGLPQLWRLRPDSGTWQALLPGTDALDPSADRAGQTLVYAKLEHQVDLWRAPLDGGEAVPLLESTRRDWAPAVAPDGRNLAWLSDRSGSTELWLAALDGTAVSAPRLLSRFEGPHTQAPVWAPDGQTIFLSAPAGKHYALYVAQPTQPLPQALSRISPEGRDASSPVPLDSGGVLRQQLREETSDLVDEDGEVHVPDVRKVKRGPGGELWFCRPGRAGLWKQAPGESAVQVVDDLATADWMNWWVDAQGLLYVRRDAQGQAQLWQWQDGAGAAYLRELPGLYPLSGLARLGDAVIYARRLRLNTDLYRYTVADD